MNKSQTDLGSLLLKRRVGAKSRAVAALKPDPVYNNMGVSFLTNSFMKGGNKSVVYREVILPAMRIIQEKTGDDPCKVIESALEQATPSIELGSSGGSSHHQVPVDVPPLRGVCMGKRFIRDSVRTQQRKGGRRTCEVLAEILIASANGKGPAIEKKDQSERTAAANSAFKSF